jgi:hypothetical protein
VTSLVQHSKKPHVLHTGNRLDSRCRKVTAYTVYRLVCAQNVAGFLHAKKKIKGNFYSNFPTRITWKISDYDIEGVQTHSKTVQNPLRVASMQKLKITFRAKIIIVGHDDCRPRWQEVVLQSLPPPLTISNRCPSCSVLLIVVCGLLFFALLTPTSYVW